MSNTLPREAWLSGPVASIPELLQPVAHALLQSRKEVHELVSNFPSSLLWERPSGVASPAFHLQHLAGVLDRLFTYARGAPLNAGQLAYLDAEGKKSAERNLTTGELLQAFDEEVEKAMEQLRQTTEKDLLQPTEVGRAKLPSNTLGLLFHAAEHTQRHVGQLLVTVRVLYPGNK